MIPAPSKILFFSTQDEEPTESDQERDHWRAYFPSYDVDVSADARFAVQSLQSGAYDLIILDDQLFGDAIYVAILQLKQMKLLIPILVLTANDSLVYQTNLMEAGAEDILLTSHPTDYLQRRLNLCLKRNEQNREVIRRNQKLYEITILTRHLHANSEPQMLIEETIMLICGAFPLYGVAIVLQERGILRVYSNQETQKPDQKIEVAQTLRDADANDPFNRVIRTGVTEMFDDITRDRYYAPLPHLSQARSAIVMPLPYQTENLGALALFGSFDAPISVDDLGIYEIVTTQFALALQNAYFNRMQFLNIQNGRILLNAWQSFLRVQSGGEVAESLRQHIEQLASVDQTIVWINSHEKARSAAVFTRERLGAQVFSDLLAKGTIDALLEGIEQGPHIVAQLGLSPGDPLLPLFRVLHARQLIFMPLADSARLIGGVLTSVSSDRQMSLEDANILKSLSHAAGQALERMMLIEGMTEKSGRLEAILRSITEGIFFVDDKGRIAYCNPQMTELTNVNPSEMLGERPDVLLNRLAEQAVGVEKAKLQFYNAVSSMQTFTGTERNYPIVELTLKNSEQQLHVEFVAMGRLQAAGGGWIGLVWTSARASAREAPSESVDLLLHMLHSTGGQLRTLAGRFAEAHSQLEQKRLLDDIERGGSNFEQLLEQYAKLYDLNISEPLWNAETIELGQLVEDLIRTHHRATESARAEIEAQLPPDLLYIEMDRGYVEKGLLRLLDNFLQRLTPYDKRTITIRMDDHEDEVYLSFAALVVNPQYIETSEDARLWDDICAMNHCRYWREIRSDSELVVTISFPKLLVTSGQAISTTPEMGAPLRTPEAVMVIQGRSAITNTLISLLERQGLSLYRYETGEEAVQDVNLMRLDLIVVDGNLPDEDSLEVCKQLRRHTEVPVVIVATRATNLERVDALRAGADDYITEPISNDELLAKISVLFKRQNLADRTEEPLDLGDLRIDFSRRAVFVNHKPVLLTRIEYDLLRTLAVNMGQVLTHQQLLEKVWGPEYRSETQYLWVNISRLRKKLEPTAYIHNQQGIGYVFQTM